MLSEVGLFLVAIEAVHLFFHSLDPSSNNSSTNISDNTLSEEPGEEGETEGENMVGQVVAGKKRKVETEGGVKTRKRKN
jgi:hypothetical protein